MATPAEYIALLGPEYVDDPRLALALELAASELALDHCFFDKAVALLALHSLAVSDRGASVGAVVSESEGGLSRSFSVGASTGPLSGTSYGVELDRLNRLCYGMTARTAWGENTF